VGKICVFIIYLNPFFLGTTKFGDIALKWLRFHMHHRSLSSMRSRYKYVSENVCGPLGSSDTHL